METIVKLGIKKIMNLFYKNKEAKIHLRNIARQTKLNENSATRFLKELEKGNILKAEKEGNLKRYSIKKNSRTYLIFTFFDIERFEKLPSIRKNALKYYLNAIEEKPIIAFLFGSTAKETFKEDSDIDILLITNKKINTSKAEKEAEALTSIKISNFQMTFKSF